MNKNQKGAIDALFVITLVVVLAVGGFLLWRISNLDEGEPVESPVDINNESDEGLIIEQKSMTKASYNDLPYEISFPDGWYELDEEVGFANYDPNRDSSDFNSSQLHHGLEGDIKIILSAPEAAESIESFIATENGQIDEIVSKSVVVTDLALDSVNAKYVQATTEYSPINYVVVSLGDKYIRVGLGGNGFESEAETLDSDVVLILNSIK